MSGRDALAKRSLRQWAVRAALAVAVLVVGYQATALSIARVVVAGDPARAHGIAPHSGQITARYAKAVSSADVTPVGQRKAAALARLALLQDQTALTALSTLGIAADTGHDVAAARRFFGHAQGLSRRDMPTQLWMIEDAVNQGQIARALHQYDLTLRVFPALWEILFPILTSASSEVAIRTELIRTLARRPPWSDGLIVYIAGHGRDPMALYALFTSLQRAGVPVQPATRAAAVNALLYAGKADAAWSYYTATHGRMDRDRSRDPRFSASTDAPSLLDWITRNEDGIAATAGGGVFDFAVPASVGGTMLQQFELLSPGQYHLTGHSSGIDQAEFARPYWILTCQDGRELGRVVLPNSADAGGRFSGAFTVPAGCPVQTLALVARPSDTVSGLSGQLHDVQIVR